MSVDDRAAGVADPIRTAGLTKRYGPTLAVDGLNLVVPHGEVYGFLGPNGAGKTTTIRLLLGLHRPTAGSAALFGIDAWREPVVAHRRVAYVAGEPSLWPQLTGEETLEFLGRVHGSVDVAYRRELVQRFELEQAKRIRALSKGNRQKVQLIAALATRADLLVLDEPTSGLDPLMEVVFRDCVREAKARGQTVFLSSHILGEVEALCDRVGILRRGQLVDEGTLAELRHLSAETVEVTFAGQAPHLPPLMALPSRPPARTCSAVPSTAAWCPSSRLSPGQTSWPYARASPRSKRSSCTSTGWRTVRPAEALALRTLADARVRTLGFALLLGGFAAAQAAGYRRLYPTLADRLEFARTFGENKAARLFYGTPYRLDTVGGYVGWRAGLLVLFAAFFGLFAAVRAFRGEEEAGRIELVAAGAITRSASCWARLAAVGAMIIVLWLAVFLGLIVSRLPLLGSAYLATVIVAPGVVYAGVGMLASQLMPSGAGALELGGGVLGVDFALRVVADTADLPALHWTSPLGWAEESRPFAGARPEVLLPFFLTAAALLVLSLAIERRRDIGTALLALQDAAARPRLRLLRSPALLAMRSQEISLAIWTLAAAGFAFIIGTVSRSVASGLSETTREQLQKIGACDVATPSGYIGLTFLFFILAVSLFCCGQVAAARQEEEEGRLETLFALPVSRSDWFAGRLALAAAGATLIAVMAGAGAAAGATAVGADVSVPRLLEAGLNTLPASLLFLGIAAFLVAAAPRVGAGTAYAVVIAAFVWELVGALLGAPPWLLDVSPFHHVGLVPAAPFRALSAAVMLAAGAAAAVAAVTVFRLRDLTGA